MRGTRPDARRPSMLAGPGSRCERSAIEGASRSRHQPSLHTSNSPRGRSAGVHTGVGVEPPPKRRSSLDESPSKPGTPGACPSFDYSSARQVSTAISSTSCPTTANRSATPRWYACRPTTRCVLVVVRSGAVGENGRGRGCLRLRRGRNRREAPAASCFPTRTEREVMTMVTGRLSVAGTGQLQSSTAISTSSSNRATVRMALILIKRAPESCNRRIRLVR